jgi:high-affinity K+ transport system ATPase subunit B
MIRNTLLTTALVFAVSLPTFAATPAEGTNSAQHQAAVTKCQKKAKEHKVTQDKMQSYMSSCESKEMKKAQEHASSSTKKTMPSGE